MTVAVRPILQTVVDQSLLATGASCGWLLAATDHGFRVLAAGGPVAAERVGTLVAATGARGYVLSSGQPTALMPPSDDTSNQGAGGHAGIPTSLLAAPCGREAVLGVLEVADRVDGGPFGFDDLEAVAGLAAVAGTALAVALDPVEVPSPEEVAARLRHLAATDPRRYLDTARVIGVVLGQRP
jgi:GAF domain-containing protein